MFDTIFSQLSPIWRKERHDTAIHFKTVITALSQNFPAIVQLKHPLMKVVWLKYKICNAANLCSKRFYCLLNFGEGGVGCLRPSLNNTFRLNVSPAFAFLCHILFYFFWICTSYNSIFGTNTSIYLMLIFVI